MDQAGVNNKQNRTDTSDTEEVQSLGLCDGINMNERGGDVKDGSWFSDLFYSFSFIH